MSNETTPDLPIVITNPSPAISDQAASLQRIIAELSPLSSDDRRRLLETVTTFFGIDRRQGDLSPAMGGIARPAASHPTTFRFAEDDETPTPKSFMLEKSPTTDVERVACLAYYLTHHRATPHFKTRDISDLNRESAHRPFSNAAVAVDNATKSGYLVPSVKGAKQLSAAGEQFVQALPNHDIAKQAMERFRPRRNGSRRDASTSDKE